MATELEQTTSGYYFCAPWPPQALQLPRFPVCSTGGKQLLTRPRYQTFNLWYKAGPSYWSKKTNRVILHAVALPVDGYHFFILSLLRVANRTFWRFPQQP